MNLKNSKKLKVKKIDDIMNLNNKIEKKLKKN